MSGMYGNITVQVPYESVEGKTLYVNNDTNISGSTASGDNVNADYNVRWIYPGGIISKGNVNRMVLMLMMCLQVKIFLM